jgi:[protein-PII] uridylyltransferase
MRRALGNLPGRQALPAVFVRGRRRGPRLAPLAKGLAELGGEVVLEGGGSALDDPVLPLRAARVAAERGLHLELLTARALRRAPALPGPWPAEARAELAAFLAAGDRIVPVWEELDQAGAVARLWPEWAPVRNQAQRNPLHRHTVDRHQVEAAALVAQVDTGTAPRALVGVAALFHDIGKRPGEKDHAGLGALLAAPLFRRLGYPEAETAFMVALVRHHLTLAALAVARDPSDPATAAELLALLGGAPQPPGPGAARAGSGLLALVDGLAALTEADARAAGPKAWTKQRAALIGRLVAAARSAAG